MAQIFNQAFEQKLIYVYRINDTAHEGILKVGEASCNAGMAYFAFGPNCKELNAAAKKRIDQQTQTAGVRYELLYTEATAYMKGKNLIVFQDHEIHNILERSGIKHKYFDPEHKANEWFYTDLETVKKAIAAAKEGRTSLNASEVSKDKNPIIFRPEQQQAINRTIKQFTKKNSSNQMLWNAKMRFGKTLTALQIIKEMDFGKTLILTHRPVVDKGWFDDCRKIFYDRDDFFYCSKNMGGFPYECLNEHIIYFASIQDMRGSELVGGKFAKNEEIFNIDWDLIIIDEAHEGTQTELGKNVIAQCKKENTKILHLSGTPFNLMDDFKEEEIYTWDYVMEQKAKAEWDIIHKGDPNPYAGLPRLNIYTYDLGKLYPDYSDADIAFNFREFFRVNEDGEFIHESVIKQFLNLMTKEDPESNYPYSTEYNRENFRHSLWIIPGVKEAKALSKLLQQHPVFSQFNIANVAGDGDEEEEEKEALKKVEKAITNDPGSAYSITLSCGRLTTGVSVPAWTACFMLSGSYNTSASSYMQTIFRVQTPAIIDGKQKEECFVFDFAPDRTLKVIAETAKISSKAGKTTQSDRAILGEFLNFCPIIGFDGSKMRQFDTEKMLGQLKKVYIERVVRNGFEDSYLYNDKLLKLGEIELKQFDELKGIIGSTKAMAKTSDIDINSLGLTNEEYEDLSKPKSKKEKRELTPEEEEQLRKLAEAKKNRDAAVSILRGISIRMPLLIYGAKLNIDLLGEEEVITIDNFTDLVDDLSWKEFMPNGVTKERFGQFKKYYDQDVFRESGIRIREMARAADKLSIEERIERISAIFNTFRNPDKETVLTPWRVVNMHLTDCLGGYRFYNEDYSQPISEPVFVTHPDITKDVYKKNSKILEINAKSGLYALYCAYSVYKARAKFEIGPNPTREMERELWAKVLKENIFVICKTPMAKSITKRTLAGFTEAKVNAHYFEDLVNQLKNKRENFISKVNSKNYWIKGENGEMKFDAIVGNPPYQEMDGGNNASALPVYNKFVLIAKDLSPQSISMIIPAKWFTGGRNLEDFRKQMLNDKRISFIADFCDSRDLFPTVDVSGGICYFLWRQDYSGDCLVTNHKNGQTFTNYRNLSENEIFVRYTNDVCVLNKIKKTTTLYLSQNVYGQRPFGLRTFEKPLLSGDIILRFNKGKGPYLRSKIVQNSHLIDKWKVITTRAASEHAGQADKNGKKRVLAALEVLQPGEICTETYILINTYDSQAEAENCLKYLKSKLARYLLSIAVTAQMISQNSFTYLPLQDFTPSSDIDWSKSVPEIDKQLYAKYGLDEDEINFIESMIKEM